MAEGSFLCKCVICLKENPGGIQLTLNTYNRHRKRQQELSKREIFDQEEIIDLHQIEVIHQEEDTKNIYQEENLEFQIEDIRQGGDTENIYQMGNLEFQVEDIRQGEDTAENIYQEENLEFQVKDIHQGGDTENICQEENLEFRAEDIDEWEVDELDEDSNTSEKDTNDESFSIDEEDKEYYEEDDDDDDNDDDNDDDTMQIDDETDISKKMLEGLKLLHLKSLYNFTESAYDDIMKIFTTDNISLYKVKKYLKDVTGLVPVFYDMCENSCICYTGDYESYENCPTCESSRFDGKGKSKKVMPYLSVKDRLRTQFSNENRAKELLYRHEYIANKDDCDLDDIFDGNIYKELFRRKFIYQ